MQRMYAVEKQSYDLSWNPIARCFPMEGFQSSELRRQICPREDFQRFEIHCCLPKQTSAASILARVKLPHIGKTSVSERRRLQGCSGEMNFGAILR